MKRLDASWKAWVKENIERGCDAGEIFDILTKNSFTADSIREAMGAHFPAHIMPAGAGQAPSTIDHEGLCNVRLTRAQTDGVSCFPTGDVQLYTIDHFMSDGECDALVALIGITLRASTVTIEAPNDKYYRTSSTSDLSLLNDKTVEALDKKISRALGIRPSHSEGIQGQHYAVGQEFKKHTDFFEPGTQEYEKHASKQGNRTWTFMVYLNDVPEGGGTHFVDLQHIFQPQKGRAVIWNNLYADGTPNYMTLHAGMPVTKGTKTIITKWFREKGSGPMFFAD